MEPIVRVLMSRKKAVNYSFSRHPELPGWWRAHKEGMLDPYLVNLNSRTCTCDAGRKSRNRCKHLTEALELEKQMSGTAQVTSPTPTPSSNGVASQSPTAMATADPNKKVVELLMRGNLATLTDEEKVQYVLAICDACALDPRLQPFEFITFKGKTVLYAKKSCTEQLRKRDKISLSILRQEEIGGVFMATVEATTPDGRKDSDLGAVYLGDSKGEQRANEIMKAITKAKRRVTLSICGLGILDESEVESAPIAQASYQAQAQQFQPTTTSPTIVITPPVSSIPSSNPVQPGFDRLKVQIEVDGLVSALGLHKDLEKNLQKAYGKANFAAMTDSELADLHQRLSNKKASAQPASAA